MPLSRYYPGLSNRLKRMEEVGVKDSLSYFLSKAGLRIHTRFRYPGIDSSYRVRYNYIWREIEQGYCEAEALGLVSRSVQKGHTVFDIGSWIGTYAILFSELVGDEGRVVVFEPDPKAFEILCENLMINAARNVRALKIAISDRSGTAILAASELGWSGASLFGHGGSKGLQTALVETISLDEYCEREDLYPDWVKIDVEGAEGLVARGMSRLMEVSHPKVLVEFHGDLMSSAERSQAWSSITRSAKRVTYVQGDNVNLGHGDELNRDIAPSCRLIAFLQY